MKKLLISLMAVMLFAGCASQSEPSETSELSESEEKVAEVQETEEKVVPTSVHGYGKYVSYPEDGRTQIYITSQEELDQLMAAPIEMEDCDIRISAGKYEVPDYIFLSNSRNVRMIGEEETELVCLDEESNVIITQNCENMEFANLILGHKEAGSCEGAVVRFISSEDMKMVNCDLYGCGTEGINLDGGSADLHGVTIRDCSEDILTACRGSITGDDCLFVNNDYNDYSYLPAYTGINGEMALSNSDVFNNMNDEQASIVVSYDNVTEEGNGWN